MNSACYQLEEHDLFVIVRKDLSEYFQNIIKSINKNIGMLRSAYERKKFTEYGFNKLDKMWESMLITVNKIFNDNLNDLNEYSLSSEKKSFTNKEKLKSFVLKSHCYYVQQQYGYLITTDWYLDQNQIKFLKFV